MKKSSSFSYDSNDRSEKPSSLACLQRFGLRITQEKAKEQISDIPLSPLNHPINFWTQYVQHQANIYRGPFLGGSRTVKNTLCQFCVNLIDSSWHLVTQHATSVTVSLIKIMVNKLKKD